MTDIKPLADYILIEPLEDEDRILPSGIILPDQAKERPQQGKVLAVSDEIECIYPNDIVYYKKWGGSEIKYEGKDCLLISEEDILAVVEEEVE